MTELPRRRVTEVWTWLPAFRAVAEVEHVQRAAKELHVTASSLSRAIRLLEEHVGKKLFDRVGRNVRLNADGRAMLAAVGEAMRRIDSGLAQVTGTTFAGELRVACEGDQPLELAWQAASRLMKAYPGLVTSVEEITSKREIANRLVRGELDVAVVTSARADARLAVDEVATVTYGIYCGATHPLRKKRSVDAATLAEYPFVAPSGDAEGPDDQWPGSLERRVALRLPALAAAVKACESGEWLAVIPDDAATPSLVRLPSESIPRSRLFAIRRRPLGGEQTKADAFVAALAKLPKARRRGSR